HVGEVILALRIVPIELLDPATQGQRLGDQDAGVDQVHRALAGVGILLLDHLAHAAVAIAQHAAVTLRVGSRVVSRLNFPSASSNCCRVSTRVNGTSPYNTSTRATRGTSASACSTACPVPRRSACSTQHRSDCSANAARTCSPQWP